jgi:hypothetical protein
MTSYVLRLGSMVAVMFLVTMPPRLRSYGLDGEMALSQTKKWLEQIAFPRPFPSRPRG